MSAGGWSTEWRRQIAENVDLLSRVHERYRHYRQTTGGEATAYIERELQKN